MSGGGQISLGGCRPARGVQGGKAVLGGGVMVGCSEVEEVHGLGISVGKQHVFVKCGRAFQVDWRARVW